MGENVKRFNDTANNTTFTAYAVVARTPVPFRTVVKIKSRGVDNLSNLQNI